MLPFTLRQLEYFVACVDHGSIAKAAGVLNVSQPTISVAIGKLEEHFGLQLLMRHHAQGVSVTSAGLDLMPAMRRILAEAQDLQRQAQMSETSVAGDVRIGSFSPLAPVVLPKLIAALREAYPDIRLHITEGAQDGLLSALRNGAIDLALLYDLELPAGLRIVDLIERAPYVALPKGHPLALGAEVGLEDLVAEPLILLDVAPSRNYFLGLFEAQGLTPNIAHSSPSLELVRGMVGQGLGVSLLVTRPEGDVTHDGQALEIRPLRGDMATSRIVLASLANLRPTQLVKSVEAVASEVLAT